jgi:tetratricopeptide (TPR) repeat protein
MTDASLAMTMNELIEISMPETRAVSRHAVQIKTDRSKGASPVSVLGYEEDMAIAIAMKQRSGDGMFLPLTDSASSTSQQSIRTPGSLRSSSSEDARLRRRGLPTLDEASCSEYTALADNKTSPAPIHPRSTRSELRTIQQPPLDHDEVQQLKDAASQFALRGNESRALKTYKRALKLTTLEVARLKGQLQLATTKPPHSRQKFHKVLNDEWEQVAMIVADIRTMMAIIYERTGDYDRAIACCNEVRGVFERQAKHDKKSYHDLWIAPRNVQQMTRMILKMEMARDTLSERKGLHEESVKIHQQARATKDVAVKDLLFEDIFDKLSAVLTLELDILGDSHPQVADTIGFLGQIYVERGELDKALDSTYRAVKIAELSLGALHHRTAQKYHALARVYDALPADEASENAENAITYYEKSIDAFQEADGEHSKIVGSTLNDVAVLYTQRGDFDAAIRSLNQALDAYANVYAGGEGVCAESIQVWRNLAECYFLQTEYEKSILAFTNALQIQRDAKKFHDYITRNGGTRITLPELVSDENIGDTLKRLGMTYFSFGRFDDAVDAYSEALTTFEAAYDAVKRKKPSDKLAKQDQVAHTLFCLAEAKSGAEAYDEAAIFYAEAFQLRVSGEKRFRNLESTTANLVQCAQCLAGLGCVRMRQLEYNEAFKVYDEALQFAKAHGMSLICSITWKSLFSFRGILLTSFLSPVFRSSNDSPSRPNVMGQIYRSREEDGTTSWG